MKGTSIIIKKPNGGEGTYPSNPAASPFQLIDQLSEDIHLQHSGRYGQMGFCYDCARACIRRNFFIGACSFKLKICRCSYIPINT